jgi:hypothetical protein
MRSAAGSCPGAFLVITAALKHALVEACKPQLWHAPHLQVLLQLHVADAVQHCSHESQVLIKQRTQLVNNNLQRQQQRQQ